MSLITKNSKLHEQMVEWRHHIHKHPELSFKEEMTRIQVESIIYGGDGKCGLDAPRCSTIERDGFCVGRCRYYDGTIQEIEA